MFENKVDLCTEENGTINHRLRQSKGEFSFDCENPGLVVEFGENPCTPSYEVR